ncbi:MAG TPA: hypothetical protein P5560_01305 [Thermotogota bacterium]|nr:hypothetical protein [Thermotogota bacterium]
MKKNRPVFPNLMERFFPTLEVRGPGGESPMPPLQLFLDSRAISLGPHRVKKGVHHLCLRVAPHPTHVFAVRWEDGSTSWERKLDVQRTTVVDFALEARPKPLLRLRFQGDNLPPTPPFQLFLDNHPVEPGEIPVDTGEHRLTIVSRSPGEQKAVGKAPPTFWRTFFEGKPTHSIAFAVQGNRDLDIELRACANPVLWVHFASGLDFSPRLLLDGEEVQEHRIPVLPGHHTIEIPVHLEQETADLPLLEWQGVVRENPLQLHVHGDTSLQVGFRRVPRVAVRLETTGDAPFGVLFQVDGQTLHPGVHRFLPGSYPVRVGFSGEGESDSMLDSRRWHERQLFEVRLEDAGGIMEVQPLQAGSHPPLVATVRVVQSRVGVTVWVKSDPLPPPPLFLDGQRIQPGTHFRPRGAMELSASIPPSNPLFTYALSWNDGLPNPLAVDVQKDSTFVGVLSRVQNIHPKRVSHAQAGLREPDLSLLGLEGQPTADQLHAAFLKSMREQSVDGDAQGVLRLRQAYERLKAGSGLLDDSPPSTQLQELREQAHDMVSEQEWQEVAALLDVPEVHRGQDPELLGLLMEASLESGKCTVAQQAARELLELLPFDFHAWMTLGMCSEPAEAVGYFRAARDLFPGNIEPYLKQADALCECQDWKGAQQTLDQAVENVPSNREFSLRLEVARAEIGLRRDQRFAEAQQKIRTLLERLPEEDPGLLDDFFSHFFSRAVEWQTRNPDMALAFLQVAGRLRPENREVQLFARQLRERGGTS